jgi:hypothetical protein
MGNKLISVSFVIIFALLGIYGGIDVIKQKQLKFIRWHFTGNREIILTGRSAIIMGVTQILFCLLILIGIITLNIQPNTNLALFPFAGSLIVAIFRALHGASLPNEPD